MYIHFGYYQHKDSSSTLISACQTTSCWSSWTRQSISLKSAWSLYPHGDRISAKTIARYLDWGATVCELIHENWCNMKSLCLMYLNTLPMYCNGTCILAVIEEVTVTRPPVLSYYISLEHLGADSIKIYRLTSIGNLIVEIRRSYDRLISTIGFPILIRWHLYIESGPRCP